MWGIVSADNRLKALSAIWLVFFVVSASAISHEWARMTNLLLDDDDSHNGLPKEWIGKQAVCIHFPDGSAPEEFADGRHHLNTTGAEVFVDRFWNESGACIGGFSGYENGFDLVLDATNVAGGKLEVGYTVSEWGPYVQSIGGHEPTGDAYWALYHDGAMAMVGIGDLVLDEDSVIVWQVDTW